MWTHKKSNFTSDKNIRNKHIKTETNLDIPIVNRKINYKLWAQFLSYYRYYMDRFAEDILGLKLYPFQKFALRCFGRYKEYITIWSRGLSKTFLTALFAVCYAILYPGSKIGITSKSGKQSRKLMIEKIQGEFMARCPNISAEIERFNPGTNDCSCIFKNGSTIFTIVLGQGQSGDGARGSRCNVILIDEAAYVKDSLISAVIAPMAKNRRPNLIEIQDKFPNKETYERNRMIYMSSASMKTCDLYKRFLMHYHSMTSGSFDFGVSCLDYKVGEKYRIYEPGEIERERDKLDMTNSKFLMEYGAQFVGSSSDSYYPYELTQTCRILKSGKLQQAKNSQVEYVITHDVAVSGVAGSDNCCTHVIELKPKGNGSYIKDVVFTKTQNGISLREQRDFLRELVHIKFPNTIKLVIDRASIGEGLVQLFCEPWTYTDDKGNEIEFPPIIDEEDIDLLKQIPNAQPLIKGIKAYLSFNNDYYSYMKACFEDQSLRLITDSGDVVVDYKMDDISEEQYALHLEHDFLIDELGNIAEVITENNTKTFKRIVPRKKRDRVTSLMYGLSYISDLEKESKSRIYNKQTDVNWDAYIGFY